MKSIFLLLLLLCFLQISGYTQETTKPIHDNEIMRNMSVIDIEGKKYYDVQVTLKSKSPDHLFSETYRVKIIIKNKEGKDIWKKTLKNVYLYVFSSGQIQVGKPNFDQVLIKPNDSGSYNGIIREKEGIY